MKCGNKECEHWHIVMQNGCAGYDDISDCDAYKPLTPREAGGQEVPCTEGLCATDDYAYETRQEYEKIVGKTMNDTFHTGWSMARVTNKQLRALCGEEEST